MKTLKNIGEPSQIAGTEWLWESESSEEPAQPLPLPQVRFLEGHRPYCYMWSGILKHTTEKSFLPQGLRSII
jgi:hypothetical protein